MSVTIYHKGVSPISAATICAIDGDYLPVEWTVVLVSLLSAGVRHCDAPASQQEMRRRPLA
jgi:hypothetical protein